MTPFPTDDGSAPVRQAPIRLVIMGPQGSGKGTQAARLSQRLAVPAISTGEVFRGHIAAQTPLGAEAARYINQGNLVPDELTNAMVRDRLAAPDAARGFILDGYPRTAAQVTELDAILTDAGTKLDGVVQLTAGHDELLARITHRAEVECRADDIPEAVRQRLEIYAERTEPLVAEYAGRGILFPVDGIGTVDEVSDRILAALGALVS